MTAEEKRKAVVGKYSTFIGRNKYSQDRRSYYATPYKDGYYYSDCSSSVSGAYKLAGLGFGLPNTAGMYNSTAMVDVPVTIKNGQITNPELLRVGDLLLYAGTDNSRPGCVGHVEMVYSINGSTVTLCGHGSGNPKLTEMTSKNKSRYNSKTGTKVGNKGLIRVRRVIQDDAVESTDHESSPDNGIKVKSGTWNIRSAPNTSADVIATVKGGAIVEPVTADGWHYIKSGNLTGWVSDKALEV